MWAVILGFAWFAIIQTPFNEFALVCSGFALGAFAMYIAVHRV